MKDETKSKALAIVSYITWIGWIVAVVFREKEDTFLLHHLNQSLLVNLVYVAGATCLAMPRFGLTLCGLVNTAGFALWVIGIIRAAMMNTDPYPVIGDIRILN